MGYVEHLIREFGYLALVLVLFLDGSGIPWPTEATLVVAGVAVRAGHLNFWGTVAACLSGAFAGATLSWYLGRRYGHTLMGRIAAFFRVGPETISKVDEWFQRHGARAVFFARLIPFVRVLVGYPAGAMGMAYGPYIVLSILGYAAYILLALFLGYAGLSIARLLGDLEIALWVIAPFAVLIVWLKWGRKWHAKRRGKG